MQARIFVALVTFMLPGAALAQLPLVIDKHFSPVTIPLNGSTTLTFDVTNNVNVAQSGIAFTDPLPTGLVVATPNGLTGSCGGGSITATAGSSSISLSGATLPAVASCTFSVNVTGVQAGVLLNTTSDITSDLTLGNPASATLTVVAPPTLTKFFDGRAINVTVPLNGTTSLTFTLTNPNVTVPVTGIGFTDTLPAGLVVATPNGVFGTCTGTVTAISGSNSIMLAGASLGTGASCTFTVDVTGTTVGTKNNTTSTVGSTEGGDGPPATATVTVLAPPTITKAFGGAIVTLGAATPLTFTVANPNPTAALAGVAFTDTLPAGLLVSTPNGLTGSCGGGTITAVAGSSSISLTGATLAASASCTFSVSVTGTSTGTKNNTTSTVTSTNGGTGLAASASILVLPADAVQIGYSANLKAGDSTVNLTNTGNVNGFDPAGDICANVYVFAEDQQLIACCTCPLTPNHLKTLSAQKDLVSNTLTPGVPIGITTMLVASSGACNASNPGPLVGGLRAWGSTLHAAPGGGFTTTEANFLNVPLSETEFTKLTSLCGFIQADGSGFGICGSCRQGAAGSVRQ